MSRQPLSEDLLTLCQDQVSDRSVSINDLLHRTEGRGLYLLFILLSLPFITPIPLPAFSTVIGTIFLFLGIRLALGLPATLPRFLGDRPMPFSKQQKLILGSVRILKVLEKFARPRAGRWMRSRTARCGNGFLLAALGALLILPFPPLVFFTNSLPAWGVILICASLVEEDGFLIWIGYGLSILAAAYIFFLLFGGTKLIVELVRRFF